MLHGSVTFDLIIRGGIYKLYQNINISIGYENILACKILATSKKYVLEVIHIGLLYNGNTMF